MRPRPGVARPAQLVDIGRTQDGSGFDTVSYANYIDYQERNAVFSGVAAYDFEPLPLGLGSQTEAERIYGMTVSGNYFSVLGVRPAAGRFFAADEDAVAGERRAVVLSYQLWERKFRKDPSLIGKSIILNSYPFAVVGVAAKEFRGTSILKADVWIPLHALSDSSLLQGRDSVWLVMIGRLKPGISTEAAQASMSVLASALEKEYPEENRGKGISLKPFSPVPGELSVITAFLGFLQGLSGLVLLIACVNLSGMILARNVSRRRELAVRLALGSGRFRLARQLMFETLAVFALGGAAGLWIGFLLLRFLPLLFEKLPVPVWLDVSLNWQVLLFTAAVTVASGILCGLLPALRSTRSSLVPALKDEEASMGKLRLRNVLLSGQVAFSVLLLITAALFVRALQRAASIDTGFDPTNVHAAELDLRLADFRQEKGLAFTDDLLQRAASLPGVTSVSFTRVLPLTRTGFSLGSVVVPGRPASAESPGYEADWNIVSPNYFQTLRIPIVAGRGFLESDDFRNPMVAIVNETLAKELWPGQPAIGQRFYDAAVDGRAYTIVGIAKDSKYRSLSDRNRLFVYVPLKQNYHSHVTLLLRTSTSQNILPAVRTVIHQLNPYLPIVKAQPLQEITNVGLFPQQIAVSAAGSLGLIGLLLASIGLYGVTAYAVIRRRREIGIRIALGSQKGRLLRLILWNGIRWTTIGIVAGVVLAMIVTRLLAGMLFGIPPNDVTAFASSAALFFAITAGAAFFAARKAASVSPSQLLRSE